MAFTYETTPDLLAAELTRNVQASIEAAIKQRLQEEATKIIDDVARKMAQAIAAKVTMWQAAPGRDNPYGDKVNILLSINDGAREQVPPAGG